MWWASCCPERSAPGKTETGHAELAGARSAGGVPKPDSAWRLPPGTGNGPLSPAIGHHRAGKRDDRHPVLIDTRRPHADNPDVRPGPGLPLRNNLRPRVDRVSLEQRIGEPDLVPPEVRHHVVRHVVD